MRFKLRYLLLLLPVLSFMGLYFMRKDPNLAEYYARYIFPKIVWIPRFLVNLLPFSLLEVFATLGSLIVLILLIGFIWRMITKPDKRDRLRRGLTLVIIIFCVMVPMFYLNFGYTYHRHALARNLELEIVKRPKEDLYALTKWMGDNLNLVSKEVNRDENGVIIPALSIDEVLQEADLAYAHTARNSQHAFIKDHLYGGHVRVKGMSKPSSHYWSYTGIVGIYVPFFVESTVNTAATYTEVISTSLHEVAHSYGFAREDEANFFSFYTGIHHPHPDFRYGAWLKAYIHTANALYKQDRDMHSELLGQLDSGIRADMNHRSAYWKQFEGPVKEVSTQINHGYLKSNFQESGVKSYGEVVDLFLAYYFDVIKD